jgi:hypothetical protein
MSQARQNSAQMVGFLRKRINYVSNGTVLTVGTIPAGASVIGGGVHVVTGFNDSGTDTVDIGFIGSTTDDNAYATIMDLTNVGWIVLDELATTTNIQQTVDTKVTVRYNGQNSNASAGVADVIIWFVPNTDN